MMIYACECNVCCWRFKCPHPHTSVLDAREHIDAIGHVAHVILVQRPRGGITVEIEDVQPLCGHARRADGGAQVSGGSRGARERREPAGPMWGARERREPAEPMWGAG